MKDLKAKREYLKKWLERLEGAQDAVPSVQMSLEMTDWQIDALSNRPEEADEIPLGDLERRFAHDYAYLIQSWPAMPEYDPDSLVAANTSSTSSLYTYVGRVGDLGTPQAQEYSAKYTTTYRNLQTAQSRPKEVRGLLKELGREQMLERFDRAFDAYFAVRSGTGERTAAATEMRTLLDGVQGVLFEKARKRPKENMTWETMADRVGKGKARGTEHKKLVDQESARRFLISRLSDVLKGREGDSLTNLDNVWTQVLDHIYVVLKLIEVS